MANGYGSSSSSTQSTTQGSVSSVARSGIGVSQQISSLTIDTSDMPTAITSRVFSVTGGKNAKFNINIGIVIIFTNNFIKNADKFSLSDVNLFTQL